MEVIEIGNDGRRWVKLRGIDPGTGVEFYSNYYGVTVGGDILDVDGVGLTDGDHETVAVKNSLGI